MKYLKCRKAPYLTSLGGHQRRNGRVNPVTRVIEKVPPYCYWCGELLEEGPDTPIPGDRNWHDNYGSLKWCLIYESEKREMERESIK